MRKITLTLTVLLLFTAFSYALQGSTKGFPKKAPDIQGLITDEGKPFSLEELKGKVVILTYGYTQCPHVCPTILAFLEQVKEKLDRDGMHGKYQIVFVSVDPEHDTVKNLQKYKKEHGFNDFIFLTGDRKALEKVWKDYHVYVKDRGYMEMKHGDMVMKHKMIDHTAKITIIDKNGYIREEFLGMYLPVDKIVEDVETLIKE